MLTKPLNNKIRSSDQTHGRPLFSLKSGLANLFELSHNSQPTSDNTPHTLDASSFLQSSPSIEGSTRIELQNLPIGRLRRPDTETGLRAPMTYLSELARSPSRSPVPEIGPQPEQATKKPPSPWSDLTCLVAGIMILQIILAVVLGSATVLGTPSIFDSIVIFGYVIYLIISTTEYDIKDEKDIMVGLARIFDPLISLLASC